MATSSPWALLWSSHFFKITSMAQSPWYNSYFFRAAFVLGQLLFLEQLVMEQSLLFCSYFFFRRPSFSERNFYRAPTSWEKKEIGSFNEANLLTDHEDLGGLSCSNKRHMRKSYFFEAVTSTWHQICQNSCVLAYPKSGTKEPGLLMGSENRDPKTIS